MFPKGGRLAFVRVRVEYASGISGSTTPSTGVPGEVPVAEPSTRWVWPAKAGPASSARVRTSPAAREALHASSVRNSSATKASWRSPTRPAGSSPITWIALQVTGAGAAAPKTIVGLAGSEVQVSVTGS